MGRRALGRKLGRLAQVSSSVACLAHATASIPTPSHLKRLKSNPPPNGELWDSIVMGLPLYIENSKKLF
jgi:hypothetical protein